MAAEQWKHHAMTVGELKKHLASIADDRIVVLSRDSEGNQYRPVALDGYGEAGYIASIPDGWYGSVTNPDDPPGYWDGREQVPALVLWPIN